MKYLGESYFNSYLYKNKSLLEEIMNFNIKNIELEKNIGIGCVRKVDISGISLDNKIFLGEVQLGSADHIHFKQVISNIKTGADIIFWVASSFDKKIINKLRVRTKQSAIKKVDIYLIKVSEETINLIKEMEGSTLERVMDKINIVKELMVLEKHIKIEKEEKINKQYQEFKNMFSYTNKADLEVIFDLIKEIIRDDYSICCSKTINNKSFFTIGSGVGDISFRISVNKKNIVIALIFSGQMKKVFIKMNEEFKSKNDLEKKIKVDEKYSKFYMEIEKDKNFYNVALEFKEFYCYFKGILNDIFFNNKEICM